MLIPNGTMRSHPKDTIEMCSRSIVSLVAASIIDVALAVAPPPFSTAAPSLANSAQDPVSGFDINK